MKEASENIINLLGIEGLSDEKRAALVAKAVELVEKRVTLRLTERLDEKALAEAAALGNDGASLAAFFAERVPDLAVILEEETERVRAELTAVAGAME